MALRACDHVHRSFMMINGLMIKGVKALGAGPPLYCSGMPARSSGEQG
jgi:hypothetical protein